MMQLVRLSASYTLRSVSRLSLTRLCAPGQQVPLSEVADLQYQFAAGRARFNFLQGDLAGDPDQERATSADPQLA